MSVDSPAAAEYRLRAFEVDWVAPLREDDSPLRVLLLAEAERWLALGQEVGYFAPDRRGSSPESRSETNFETLFAATDATSIEGAAQFAALLLEAQDDLTPERRSLLEYVFFASGEVWQARLEQLESVVGWLAEAGEVHAPPTLADEVGWGLRGIESRLDADPRLPAHWRSQDLSALCELRPVGRDRLVALEECRARIARLVTALSKTGSPVPPVREPIASARALVEAELYDDAEAILAGVEEGGEQHLLEGKIALARNRLQDAAGAFERASEAGVAEAATLLGKLLLEMGQPPAAREALERAASMNEKGAFIPLAELLDREGEGEEVLKALRHGGMAGDPLSILSLAGTLVRSDQPAAAAELLEGAGKFAPPEGLMQIALMLQEADHLPEAIAVLIEADIAGGDRAAALLGQLYQQLGRLPAAETWYRKAVAAGRTSMHLNLGNVLQAQGDRDGAEEQFRLALAAGDTGAFVNLGQVLEAKGAEGDARRAYEDAIEAGDPGGHVLLGKMLFYEDQSAAAERHLRAAIDADRYEGVMYLNALLVEDGRLAEALELASRAAEQGVQGAWSVLGGVHAALGDTKAAIEAYQRGIAEGEGAAAFALAFLQERRGEGDAAWRNYEQAFDLDYRYAANNLAVLLLREGDQEESERWFRKAVEGGDPRGLISLGSTEVRHGRLEEAREMAEVAIRLGEPSGYLLLALVASSEDRPQAAQEALDEAKGRGIVPAWGRSAGAKLNRGDVAGARSEATEGWRRLDPHSGLLLARILRRDKDLAAAEAVAREVVEHLRREGEPARALWIGPESIGSPPPSIAAPVGFAHALAELGAVLVARDRFDEASAVLSEAVSMGRGEAAFNLAVMHRRRGRSEEEEVEWLQTAADLGESDALLRLAEIHAERGDDEAAERELDRADVMGDPRVDRARGAHLLGGDRFAAAERAFQRAAEGAARLPSDLFYVGYCREQRDDLAGAAEAYEKVAEELAQAAHNLGVMRDRMGDKDGAIAAYRAGMEAGWRHSRTDLAATLIEVHRLEEAEAILAPLVEAEPDPMDLVNYGVLLKSTGRREEAVARFEEAADQVPQGLRNLARIQVEEGDLTAARETLRRALDRGMEEVALELGEICEKLGQLEEAETLYRRAYERGGAEAGLRLGFVAARLERVREDLEGVELSGHQLTLLLRGSERLEREPPQELMEVALA